jgi:hypothetical protein
LIEKGERQKKMDVAFVSALAVALEIPFDLVIQAEMEFQNTMVKVPDEDAEDAGQEGT